MVQGLLSRHFRGCLRLPRPDHVPTLRPGRLLDLPQTVPEVLLEELASLRG